MEAGAGGGGLQPHVGQAQALGQGPPGADGLGRRRVRRARPPGARARRGVARRGPIPLFSGEEDVADLEEGHVGPAVVGVGDQGPEQPRQQRRPQDRLLRRQRVLDLDGVRRQPGPGQVVGGQERRGPRLRQPGADQDVGHQPAVALVVVEPAHGDDRRPGAGDAAVAVVAGHLLDDVDLPLAVGPPRGDGDVEGRRLRGAWR